MFSLVPEYFAWHYRYGGKDLRSSLKTIIWFLWNFFSVSLLLKTLFVPWQRLDEKRVKGNLQSLFESFIINTLMRLVGAGIRLIFILFGLAVIALTFVLGAVFCAVWYILPFVLLGIFLAGLVLIIHSL